MEDETNELYVHFKQECLNRLKIKRKRLKSVKFEVLKLDDSEKFHRFKSQYTDNASGTWLPDQSSGTWFDPHRQQEHRRTHLSTQDIGDDESSANGIVFEPGMPTDDDDDESIVTSVSSPVQRGAIGNYYRPGFAALNLTVEMAENMSHRSRKKSQLYVCNECHQKKRSKLGRHDEQDGQWYCNECWAEFEA